MNNLHLNIRSNFVEVLKPGTWVESLQGLISADPELASMQKKIMARVLGLTVEGILQIIILVLLVIGLNKLFSWWTKRIVSKAKDTDLDDRLGNQRRVQTIVNLTGNVFRGALWAFGIYMILRIFGVDVTPMLAGASVFGVALGLGAQNFFRDNLAGFLTLLDNVIREGDTVRINGRQGVVEKIKLRTLYLRDADGTLHIVRQGEIKEVSNMTSDWSRVIIDIGVAYETDFQKIDAAVERVGKVLLANPQLGSRILEAPKCLGIESFGSWEVVFRIVTQVHPMYNAEIKRLFSRLLIEEFRSTGIRVPYPHQVTLTKNA